MNILMLFPYAPLPPPLDLGGTKRNLPFLEENLKRHAVSVLSYGSKDEETIFRKRFGETCKAIRFVARKRPRIVNGILMVWLLLTGRSPFRRIYTEEMQQAIDELTHSEEVDVIHCCTQMFGYFRFPDGVPVVSDTHEVTYDLNRRVSAKARNLFVKWVSYLTYRNGRDEEIALCGKFDALVATTERDYALFRKDLPHQHIAVIQNGVQQSFLEYEGAAEEVCSLVFTGKMNFYPNEHGIRFFLDEVFPRVVDREPRARLYVVGTHPSKDLLRRASDRLVVTGYVEDVRPYIARSQVYIIPLQIGGGIRGKALEAMAMKKAIVTTAIGVEGIHLVDGESALFADTPEAFAEAVLRLFKEPELRRRLAAAGYRTVTEEYNWEAKGLQLQELYKDVVNANCAA